MSEVKKYQDTGERPAEKKVHTEEAKPDAGRLYGEGEEPGREELHDGIGRSEADMLYDEELLSRIENAAARGAQLGSRYGILLATMITLLLIVAAVFILPVFFGIDKKVSDVPAETVLAPEPEEKHITTADFAEAILTKTEQKKKIEVFEAENEDRAEKENRGLRGGNLGCGQTDR